MNRYQKEVTDLMEIYGQDTPSIPISPSVELVNLRMNLVSEEAMEFVSGCAEYMFAIKNFEPESEQVAQALAKMIDGLADSLVVVFGSFVALGINADPFWDEVQRSNMSKLGEDGKPILRPDGKFLKGPNYSPPDILAMILRFRAEPDVMWDWDDHKSAALTEHSKNPQLAMTLGEE